MSTAPNIFLVQYIRKRRNMGTRQPKNLTINGVYAVPMDCSRALETARFLRKEHVPIAAALPIFHSEHSFGT